MDVCKDAGILRWEIGFFSDSVLMFGKDLLSLEV
jgi:hypothetical protein